MNLNNKDEKEIEISKSFKAQEIVLYQFFIAKSVS